ncbi:MAG: SGNH/GDSL hydrolase family protein [Pseudomonadota bacterium]
MTELPNPAIFNPSSIIVPNALVYGGLGEAPVAVTPDTPLPVMDSAAMSLIERLNREGDPASNFAESTFSSFAAPTGGGTVTSAGVVNPGVGRATFIQRVSFWATTPIAGRLQVGGSNWATGIGTPPQADIGFACGPNYPASFDVNIFVRSSEKPNLGATVKHWLDPAVSGTHYVGSGSTCFILADSINFDAKKVMLFLGDSLWNGTGPTSVLTCVPWLINNFYRGQGQDCRYILKAYSGSTTGGHETFRQAGKYEFAQVDAIFYQLGANDAGQSYSTATSMANVQAMIAWKQKRYPRAKLVVIGAPPVQTNAHETALVALRSAEAAYVAALSDPNVQFCDLGSSFDRSVYANYVGSDASGSAVHPADAGLQQEWNGGYSGFAGLRAWLEAHLPRI